MANLSWPASSKRPSTANTMESDTHMAPTSGDVSYTTSYSLPWAEMVTPPCTTEGTAALPNQIDFYHRRPCYTEQTVHTITFNIYTYTYTYTHTHTYSYTYTTYLHTYIHYITLHCVTLHYITLHCITLRYYITLHYIALHCIALHCISFLFFCNFTDVRESIQDPLPF